MDSWLEVRDTGGRRVYVNMDMAATIPFGTCTPDVRGSERAKVTFPGGDWVSVANRDDVAALQNWAEHHAGDWTVPRKLNLRRDYPEVFEVKE